MTSTYRVVWEIDVDAASPLEAAREARRIQEKRDSIAHVYQVFDNGGKRTEVDLDDEA